MNLNNRVSYFPSTTLPGKTWVWLPKHGKGWPQPFAGWLYTGHCPNTSSQWIPWSLQTGSLHKKIDDGYPLWIYTPKHSGTKFKTQRSQLVRFWIFQGRHIPIAVNQILPFYITWFFGFAMFMSPAPKHKLEIHSNRDMGVLGIEAGCPLGFCSANNYLIHVHHFTAIDCTSFSSILYSSIAFYALLFFSWFFYSVLFSVLFSRMLFCCILFFSILCDVVRISEISQLNFLWQRLKGTGVVGHTFVLFAPGTLWFLPAWRWEQSKLVWWVHLVYFVWVALPLPLWHVVTCLLIPPTFLLGSPTLFREHLLSILRHDPCCR